MTPFEQQFEVLKSLKAEAFAEALPNGAQLVSIPNIKLPDGWNHKIVTVLFFTPPGYPAAQPDCFWVEPGGLRLQNGATPQASNDSNPIPGDTRPRNTTWFSWHLQTWNLNSDSLVTYFNVVMQRLNPAR